MGVPASNKSDLPLVLGRTAARRDRDFAANLSGDPAYGIHASFLIHQHAALSGAFGGGNRETATPTIAVLSQRKGRLGL